MGKNTKQEIKQVDIFGDILAMGDVVVCPEIRTIKFGKSALAVCRVIGFTPKQVRVEKLYSISKYNLTWLAKPETLAKVSSPAAMLYVLRNSNG